MIGSIERIDRLERSIDRLLPNEPEFDELPDDLASYIAALSPWYSPPEHLSAYLEAIESTLRSEQRLALSVPPRHGKTETTLHAFPWLWEYEPERTHCYVTYEADLAASKSRKAQQLARDAGYRVTGKLVEWHTNRGGRMLATGVGGPLTGQGIDGLLVIDDPVKNRQDAESPTIRSRIHEWARDVAFTRLEPGSSCIVIQTRWHPDDLAGRLVNEGWPVINIPAVKNDAKTGRTGEAILMAHGKALWPERWPLGALERKRKEVGEFTWASLYQGRPRPRGSHVFGPPTYYRELPTSGYRVAHGVDLAYTSKTHADWSVMVTLLITGQKQAAKYYIADVQRRQCEAPQFMSVIEGQVQKHRGPVWWHCSGTEKGSAQFMLKRIPSLKAIPATADKYTRALPVSEAWNDGRVLIPQESPWLQDFLGTIEGFTGINDPNDDDVDALGSAFAAAQGAGYSFKRTAGAKRRF